jgi:hypothetical protein
VCRNILTLVLAGVLIKNQSFCFKPLHKKLIKNT